MQSGIQQQQQELLFMLKKLPALTALTLAAGMIATPMAMASQYPHGGVFADTPPSIEHYQHIKHAKETGLTAGWPDGTFRPAASVSREAVAAFMYRFLKHGDFEGHGYCFNDVKPSTTQFMKEICWLKDAGLTTGWSDGTFRPKEPITREAFMAFLSRVSKGRTLEHGGNMPTSAEVNAALAKLKDVTPTSHLFSKNIAWGKANHISEGWADGTFRPELPIERVAVITMLDRIAQKSWGDEYRNLKKPVVKPTKPANPTKPINPVKPTPEKPEQPTPATPETPKPVDPVKPSNPKPTETTVETPTDPAVSHELDMSRSNPVQKQLFPMYRDEHSGKELDRAGVIEYLKGIQASAWYYDTNGNKLTWVTQFSEGNDTNAGLMDVVVIFKDGTKKIEPKKLFIKWRDSRN